jgi:hypothetical protein
LVPTLRQLPWQLTVPEGQPPLEQVPLLHTVPVAQVAPHAPQLPASVWKFAHAPSHSE